MIERLDLVWEGPFDWPEPRKLSPLDGFGGVYLWTLEGNAGYVVIGIGLSNDIRKRFLTHRLKFQRGEYDIRDIQAARRGIRKDIWPGFWFPYNTDECRAEFVARQEEIFVAANEQMSATRIFAVQIADRRLQQRMEAGIVNATQKAPKPYCDLIANGMAISPRRDNEDPITVVFRSIHKFHNLPANFEI